MKTTTIARAGLLLGLGASLAANVAHAVAHSPDRVAPLVGAAFWPLALLITSELLFRLRFDRRGDMLTALAVGCVAAGAGWISFGHTRTLLLSWGESATGAVLGALAVDGVLVASGAALYRAGGASAPVRSGALDDECTPSALASVGALDDDCTPSAPRVHLVSALAENASAPRVHASAPDECTAGAPRAHPRDDDLRERLRAHLREHPERASARAVASALGVGQARAARLLAQVRS